MGICQNRNKSCFVFSPECTYGSGSQMHSGSRVTQTELQSRQSCGGERRGELGTQPSPKHRYLSLSEVMAKVESAKDF